jgi:hypothetical protein
MKAKIITAIIGLTVTTIVPVYANGIESSRGISESAWKASDTYQSFQCPSGTSRGEGVDMNYTTDRSDDYWFVNCSPVVEIPSRPTFVEQFPTPTLTPTPTPTVTPVETSTATIETSTSVSNTTNSSSTTSTVTNSPQTNNQLITLILELFNKIIALLAQLK